MSRGRGNDIKFFCFLKTVTVTLVTQNSFSETVICYLLFVPQKNVLGNCQLSTVTLRTDDIDYGWFWDDIDLYS